MRAPLLRALAPLLPGLRLESGAAAASLTAIRGAKSTTGIVGLPVVPNARQELQAQYQAVLDALAAIPEDAEYRRSVEKTVRWKLQAAAADIDPQRVVISNKLGWKRIALTTPEPTFEAGVWKDLKNDAIQDISYEGILCCYEQGNMLLGGKYVPQLVSVHDPDEYLDAADSPADRKMRMTNIVEAYRALSDLKAQGKVKAIGVGAKNWKIIRELHSLVELDWVMFANSMTILHHPQELIDFMVQLKHENISIINSAVFHAGFLIGGDYYDYRLLQPDSDENRRLFDWRNRFFELCRQFNLKPAVACVQFGLAAPGVYSIALNTSKPSNILANVESVTTTVPADFWMAMKHEGLIGGQVFRI